MLHSYIQYIVLYAVTSIEKAIMLDDVHVLTFTFKMKENYSL